MSTNENERRATSIDNSSVLAFMDDAPRHSVDAFLALTGVSRAWLSRNIDTIPHSRVGRFVRFSDRQIREYLVSITRGRAA